MSIDLGRTQLFSSLKPYAEHIPYQERLGSVSSAHGTYDEKFCLQQGGLNKPPRISERPHILYAMCYALRNVPFRDRVSSVIQSFFQNPSIRYVCLRR